MDKSEGKDWFAKTLNNVTEETAKVYKISRLKFETSTLTKSKNEKLSVMARRLVQLIEEGKIDASTFEPEYSATLAIDKKKEAIEQEINAIKNNLKIGFGKKNDDEESDNDDIIKIIDTDKMDIQENKKDGEKEEGNGKPSE